MKKEIIDIFARFYGDSRDKEIQKITDFLKDDLIKNGTRIYMGGEEMLFKKLTFQTDGDTNSREWIEEEGKEVDVSQMSDEELWSYIYGEYILSGKLGQISGFGSTQVETY